MLNKITSNIQNLELILENLNIGIIAHNLKREIFFFNGEAERITGHSRKKVLGNDCHRVLKRLCGEKCAFCEAEVPDFSGKKEYSINYTSKTGEQRHIEISVTRMDDVNGNFFGILAALKDVTELMNLKIRSEELESFNGIIGKDREIQKIFQLILDVAPYDYPVHITGETGTGKELVAAAIHNESRRGGAPFIPVNCGALPETLMESELFGHVKGAFSGAVREKKGRFELADSGTIFLDEVAELTMNMQVKLLRFLEKKSFEKVGGEKTIKVDTRIVSATNKDLQEEVKKKNFREDLYYRLNVIPIKVPSLYSRKYDIPLLTNHFLREAENTYPGNKFSMSNDAVTMMMNYKWPGNVRELRNIIQYAIVRCNNGEIQASDIALKFDDNNIEKSKKGPVKKLTIDAVKSALKETGGNKVKAAKLLHVGRATLYRFLKDNEDLSFEEKKQ